ncbi:MAG: DNA methyltransferase [Sediminibacterium sp.]
MKNKIKILNDRISKKPKGLKMVKGLVQIPDTSLPKSHFKKNLIGLKSQIYLGDNIEILKSISDNSLDGCITDGPYGLNFMCNGWDNDIPSVEFWGEVFRVLKPGALVASFGSPRTNHRMISNLEDTGFEVKGQINWVYASGMPKSKNLSLLIDKELGYPNRGHRVATASRNHPDGTFEPNGEKLPPYTAITNEAKHWIGYGTPGLKPAFEPITIVQKPISEKNIAANVLKWGTGGMNINGCRVGERFPADIILECICNEMSMQEIKRGNRSITIVRHTDPDCPCFQLDEQSGLTHQGHWPKTKISGYGSFGNGQSSYLGTGHKCNINAGASSYFKIIYNPKANKKDKEEGLFFPSNEKKVKGRKHKLNIHPTVKPTKLMQELIRLLIPEGGTLIDPFFGSGSTGKACLREGKYNFIGIEIVKDYHEIALKRCLYEFEKGVVEFINAA